MAKQISFTWTSQKTYHLSFTHTEENTDTTQVYTSFLMADYVCISEFEMFDTFSSRTYMSYEDHRPLFFFFLPDVEAALDSSSEEL